MIATALANVLDALDYRDDDGLITVDSPHINDERSYAWQEIRDKLEMDAAYFHGNTPVVYFKALDSTDDDRLWRLHRSLWNHNRAPLLIAVLPHEVRVYNCFAPPPRHPDPPTTDHAVLLKQAVAQLTDVLALRQELSAFHLREIVSGRFARHRHGQFQREMRVDSRLLQNLKHLRKLLMDDGLSPSVTNSLLGRSIFVRYLEDREVLTDDYYESYHTGQHFHALLQESRRSTYALFADLASRFNGDLFPVTELELSQVQPRHLALLGRFLDGQDLDSGQMYFWAYDFKYIPIELISAIYETFLNEGRQRSTAYYTPRNIVDFVLDEVLPLDSGVRTVTVLDPACGSGIFLVEAYRRLVINRRHAKGGVKLSFDELSDILTESIRGVDLNAEAIQVTAFSCYLALLDFLEPRSILGDVRFPSLVGVTLIVSDFFDPHASFGNQEYDVIVGNPPWESRLTEAAAAYVAESGRPIGDKQIAQAFLWRALELLAEGGQMGLLGPSKGFLFNHSDPNRAFRSGLFEDSRITKVVDFSSFRHAMFRRAVAPMVAVFCGGRTEGDADNGYLVHFGPHPSPMSDALGATVLASDQGQSMSRAQIRSHRFAWKVALWGSPRDRAVIERLRSRFHSLEKVAEEREWLVRVGVTVNGGDKNYAPELATLRYVPLEAVDPFHILSSPDERIGKDEFHRSRDRRLFSGPHVLIRGGVRSDGVLAATFLAEDAVFADRMYGIAASKKEVDNLKVVCAYINSSLARYYHFLTASQWGVERPVVMLAEHKAFPCAIPLADDTLRSKIIALVDRIQESPGGWDWRVELDELVYEAYGITRSEQQLVTDLLDVALSIHYAGASSEAYDAPAVDELISYAKGYSEVLGNTLGRFEQVASTVFTGTSPYRAVSVRFESGAEVHSEPSVAADPELDELLRRLGDVAEVERRVRFVPSTVRVYERDAIHMVKPAERRWWTMSAAYNDADATVAHLVRAMSESSRAEL